MGSGRQHRADRAVERLAEDGVARVVRVQAVGHQRGLVVRVLGERRVVVDEDDVLSRGARV